MTEFHDTRKCDGGSSFRFFIVESLNFRMEIRAKIPKYDIYLFQNF
ncbi:hypothetical protein LEP1GSC191_2625 [Leptospira borgpetersenii serovar Mini str. 201000851]|nr:hypothetical protein LEP1GSC066_0316 [Leptospira sp. serovar Kenya str. Sh9]ENO65567.1 hypothetical protein LEP1GSC191_2625 [Leptospira borgpetersenii serovar Mini str. 201000851]